MRGLATAGIVIVLVMLLVSSVMAEQVAPVGWSPQALWSKVEGLRGGGCGCSGSCPGGCGCGC